MVRQVASRPVLKPPNLARYWVTGPAAIITTIAPTDNEAATRYAAG